MSLPKGWMRATLGECSDTIQYGLTCTSSPKGTGYRYVRITDIQNGEIGWQDVPFANEDTEKAKPYEIDLGDILFARTGATVGKSHLIEAISVPAVFASYLIRLRCAKEILLPQFAAWYFRSKEYWGQIAEGAEGTGQPNFNGTKLAGLKIPLAPVAEQRRIVVKLNMLIARLARAQAELDRLLDLASKVRLSALRSVFQFGLEEMPTGWSRKRIDQIAEVQLGRQRSPKDHEGPNMRPYLRAGNVTWSGWDLTDVKEMNFTAAEFDTFCLREGDILLNEGSGSAKEVGKPAVWRSQIADICFQNTLLRVRPFKYDPDLLRYCLLYLALSGQFIANTKGVNIIHIGKAGLAKFIVPEPPESEQKNLLERLNVAFARADRLEAEATRASALLDRLQSAILAKAFKGELVPQDPNDESASVLLERIKTIRSHQAQSQPKRTRKASTPKAPREKAVMTKSRQDEDVKNKPYLANIIREAGGSSKVEDLFSKADLPVTDFYKQLAWEVDQGHIRDQDKQVLQAA